MEKRIPVDGSFWRQKITFVEDYTVPGNDGDIKIPVGTQGTMLSVPTVTHIIIDEANSNCVVGFDLMVRVAVPLVPRPFEVDIKNLVLKRI
ncbi:hypothetical protein KKH39_02820 [Patescibacteria group bacterium]|nr:hypothetical protein [Patescibacteria group bacterium]